MKMKKLLRFLLHGKLTTSVPVNEIIVVKWCLAVVSLLFLVIFWVTIVILKEYNDWRIYS